ncbi:MAG: hypothetical protein J4478_00195 [Candidatus Diapherotrites archaeon]|uniref:Uncharacterized protein n=1 Tax=Candidatus Iainarchaeum sp. TaxID=3101447 RepID=A0A7J4JV02_9ARCH|nr:hypothetical protein [Candidatus Diapherotrites archaeon]HIH21611.1 hypothetical protein [Candidatus Diapherotrites archaeon]
MESLEKALFILALLAIAVVLAGCTTSGNAPNDGNAGKAPPAGDSGTPVVDEKREPPQNALGLCGALSSEEISAAVNASARDEKSLEVISFSECSKTWVGFRSNLLVATVVLKVVDTETSQNFAGISVGPFLEGVCSANLVNIGDYKACKQSGNIQFGKGKYYVNFSCIGCLSGKDLELANAVSERIGQSN